MYVNFVDHCVPSTLQKQVVSWAIHMQLTSEWFSNTCKSVLTWDDFKLNLSGLSLGRGKGSPHSANTMLWFWSSGLCSQYKKGINKEHVPGGAWLQTMGFEGKKLRAFHSEKERLRWYPRSWPPTSEALSYCRGSFCVLGMDFFEGCGLPSWELLLKTSLGEDVGLSGI